MLKEYQGKHYYVELNHYQEVINVQEELSKGPLKDEPFVLKRLDEDRWVLYSECRCNDIEGFRGIKYRTWEKIKANLYKSRKGQS